MMRVLSWLLAAAIAAGAIVAFAPASLLDARVQALSGGRLRLAQTEGRWWSGRGVLASTDGRWRMPIRWRVAWPSVLRLAPQLSLMPTDAAMPTPRATIETSNDAIRLHDVAIELPAVALASMLPAGTIAAGGELLVTTDSLQLGDSGGGMFRVEWRGARLSSGGDVVDLGTVTAALSSRSEALAGAISNRDGELRVSGEVTVNRRESSVIARLAAEPGAPERVRRLLGRLGPASTDGTVSIRLQRLR